MKRIIFGFAASLLLLLPVLLTSCDSTDTGSTQATVLQKKGVPVLETFKDSLNFVLGQVETSLYSGDTTPKVYGNGLELKCILFYYEDDAVLVIKMGVHTYQIHANYSENQKWIFKDIKICTSKCGCLV